MKQYFTISKKIDPFTAGKILFTLQESEVFNNISISLSSGIVETITKSSVSAEQVKEILQKMNDVHVQEMK